MSVILMYHAIYRDQSDLGRIAVEDRPYAVSLSTLRKQLSIVSNLGSGIIGDGNPMPSVIVTFDDGHASNYDLALEVLLQHQIRAYFFVTTDFIESRPHFCTWQQLNELSGHGMIIGSHGTTHRFFDDLDDGEAALELQQSKDIIEQRLGLRADSISFPGGRYSQKTVQLAHEQGYGQLYGSKFGTIQSSSGGKLPTNSQPWCRIPVRDTTSIDEFNRIIKADPTYYAVGRTKHGLKQALKKALGNRLYHGLYKSLASKD